MSKKFTEEQYHKIVDLQENDYKFSILEENGCGRSFWRELINIEPDIARFAHENKLIDELAAIANPLTREWAHEQFVEKEKKYVWRDKYTGYVIYKMLNDWSLSATALGEKHFTETELENSPFKPEWFDKE